MLYVRCHIMWRQSATNPVKPQSLQDSELAAKLQQVCELDLDELDIDLPKGFGRD